MAISYATARAAPLLELEQERMLIRRWQVNREQAALETLITSHARQVYACATRLGYDASDREELISEGFVGLIRAAERFDVAREVRFSTYAHWWVLNSVLRAKARLSSVVDVPSHARQEQDKANGFAVFEGTAGDLDGAMVDDVHSPDPTPEEQIIARSTNTRMRSLIAEAMTELGELEREVVVSRNLRPVPDTIEDLAKRLGISREKLRQVERRALSRLKYGLLSRGVTSTQLG